MRMNLKTLCFLREGISVSLLTMPCHSWMLLDYFNVRDSQSQLRLDLGCCPGFMYWTF